MLGDEDRSAPTKPDSGETDEFARMLEESLALKSHREGDTVEGTIVSIGPEVAFVDIGGKGEAAIDVAELNDLESDGQGEVGDRGKAIVVSTAGRLRLSHKLARGAVTRQRLIDAFRAGLPADGRVEKVNKGGYEVRLAGQRAFCPISQIDDQFTSDPAVHVGKSYAFRIIECKEDGKQLVVSRRVLLKEEAEARAEEVRRAIVPGAVLTGRVASVVAFGAFVDLGGGVQGLLHVSEMGWSRVGNPAELVRQGDAITVKVLRLEGDGKKIALGLKQLQIDPWLAVAEKYKVGQVLMGKVTRLADFGAFVELERGVEALAHESSFQVPGRRDAWRATVPAGAAVPVEILSLDLVKKRIGVVVREEIPQPEERAEPEQAPGEAFGSLADKLRAAMRPAKE